MSAAAPNPSNMILIGVLGVGAYWYFSKRAIAGTVSATPAGTTRLVNPSDAATAYLKAGVDGVTKLFGGTPYKTTGAPSGDGIVTRPYQTAEADFPGLDSVVGTAAPGVDADAWLQSQGGDLGAFF